MMKLLRSQSQAVLVIILVVLGGSFIFYGVGNVPTGGLGRGNDYGRIDGQDLSVAELYQAIRSTHDSVVLFGNAQQLNQPDARKQIAEEAWRQLLLLHEADRMHIQVSDQELVNYIRNLPLFQKDGVFSPELYQTVMTNLDNRYHINSDSFETVLKNSLRANTVKSALFSTIRTPPGDVAKEYGKYYGPVQLSLVTFDPKTFSAAITISPEQIEAQYKAHPDNPAYRTPEKRKVDYVIFPLSPDQMKLPAKEKAAAIEAVGEKALDFAIALQPEPSAGTNGTPSTPPDFQAEAKKRGLNPVTTDFFTADTPPAGLPPSPAFNNAAFDLSKDNPVSKVVELDNGVAVLHLDDVQPSELRPLDAVKGDIVKELQESQGGEAAEAAAEKASQALQAALAKGTDFKTAAAVLKLPVQTVPTFVPATAPRTDLRLQTLAMASAALGVNEVSRPVPLDTNQTILLLHLDSRGPADTAKLPEFETRFRAAQDEQLRATVYVDWANWESKQPGTRRPPDLDQYGGVE
jgi:peptidyl-prolyl cis-trans isomerase D